MGLKQALQLEAPLQVVGAINAYSALLAQQQGFKALYLSGAGVANASLGLPDLGMSNLNDVLEDARRITAVTDLPLLVDIDTGWGNALTIARAVKALQRAGVAAIHIEDQVQAKRCGHRPNKSIVSQSEMVNRVKAAVDAKVDDDFVIMARTDAYAVLGMNAAVDRAMACVEAGAEMIFPEAITTLSDYRRFCEAVNVPVLANITEFGQTPLFSLSELSEVGIQLALYPLTAFRMMSAAAIKAYQALRTEGTQASVISDMQTRNDLYACLDYHRYEQQIDAINQLEGEK